jgi:Cyclin, C-terminal domain
MNSLMTVTVLCNKGAWGLADVQDANAVSRLAGNAFRIMDNLIVCDKFLQFPPSLTAAAVLVAARRISGIWPFWPSSLAVLTGERSCHWYF